jgi:hypothetical protein
MQWATPWNDNEDKRDLEVRVFWPDDTEFIGLKILSINTGRRIDVPVQRTSIGSDDLDDLSQECVSTAAATLVMQSRDTICAAPCSERLPTTAVGD